MDEKSMLRVLAGKPVWPPPIWMMRQARRYSGEYRVLRGSATDLLTALFKVLIQLLTKPVITLLEARAATDAGALMIFNSVAGVLPPALLRRYATKPAQRIRLASRQTTPHATLTAFPPLAGTMALSYAETVGLSAVAVDAGMDLATNRAKLPPSMATQGNLDPIALNAGVPVMRESAAEILRTVRGTPHIFNLGHGIVQQTPPAHVAELVDLVRSA
jgi:uroporphyrinogen decarboxylase